MTCQRLALALFLLYLAVFPGSTVTVALDRVPAWGTWMGGALLLVQGASVLCWLLGHYGRRGAITVAVVFLLGWGIEHLGVITGFPFGRYRYTGVLQPQLFGTVPLAIPCAWLMVAVGAWQLAYDLRFTIYDLRLSYRDPTRTQNREPRTELCSRLCAFTNNLGLLCCDRIRHAIAAATLVLLLDLQIETVATAISGYWIWLEHGPYYDVPVANFMAWWLVGGMMALVVTWVLREPTTDHRPPTTDHWERGREQRTKPALRFDKLRNREVEGNKEQKVQNREPGTRNPKPETRNPELCPGSRFTFHVSRLQPSIPSCLYLSSTLMFAVVNLARGYIVAGLVGLAVILWAAFRASAVRFARAGGRAARRTTD